MLAVKPPASQEAGIERRLLPLIILLIGRFVVNRHRISDINCLKLQMTDADAVFGSREVHFDIFGGAVFCAHVSETDIA